MKRVTILAALALGTVISCGPPPAPLSGKLWWSFACDTSIMGQTECGNAPSEAIEGSSRRTPAPALDVGCFIDRVGNNYNFRVRIEQDNGSLGIIGISGLCGTSSGSGMASNSRVSVSFGAARVSSAASGGAGTSGGCDVKIDTINETSISGQFRCAGVRDDSMNFRRVNGVAPPSMFATPDPAWARFEFAQCTTGAGACR
jgi:hypothetical protein